MILIASHNAKLAMRWTRALRGKYDWCVITEKSALEESLCGLKPGVLLLDVGLPRLRAGRELPNIQRLSPATKVIVLSGAHSSNEGTAILKAGAKGYCSHSISGTLLQKAIKAVSRGEFWAGRQIVSELIDEVVSADNHRKPPAEVRMSLDRLSPRQRQIAALVVEAARNKEIANRLNISEGAVKAHLGAMFRKFNLSTRLELARLFATLATVSTGSSQSP
jgi:two-component system, NarL family, nitrate/nitrite response regulator NarL